MMKFLDVSHIMNDLYACFICITADVGTVEVAAIQTPGRKERAKILKRQRALVDVATVIPNMYVIDFL